MVEATIEDLAFTEAKLFPKADMKPFDITETRMLPFFIEERTYVIINLHYSD